MRFSIILKVFGLLLMVYSLSMLPPTLVSFIYNDGTYYAFLLAFSVLLFLGLISYLPVRHVVYSLRTRDGFIIVFLFWFVLGLAGAIPLYISHEPQMHIYDAIFESISGLTTTGATVLSNLDDLPPAILYYRQQLQFLGGMGIIVLAVAILPMLGIGGMQLYRAESTGPHKDNKLTPRLAESAKVLWLIYVGLTITCGFCYWFAGMSPMDAINFSFSTLSTGGFAPYDAGFNYYPENDSLKLIACLFMFLGSVSFTLHFLALRHGSYKAYFKDMEFKFFSWIVILATLAIFYELTINNIYTNHKDSIINSLFQVLSFSSTTGFVTASYYSWPAYSPYLLLLIATIGGCAGSTSGGIKSVRVLLLIKQSALEIKKLIHPNANFIIKFNDTHVSSKVMQSVWAFVAVFVIIFIVLTMLLLMSGLDLHTAFSTVTTSLANLGPALGVAIDNFQYLSNSSKMILCFTMIMGRLEIFTVLVLFSSTFWRS